MAGIIYEHKKRSLAKMISWSSPPCDGAAFCHLADIAKALGEHIEAIGAAGYALLALFIYFLGYGAVLCPPSLMLRESAAAYGIETILFWMRSRLNGIGKSGLLAGLLRGRGSLPALGVRRVDGAAVEASLKRAACSEPRFGGGLQAIYELVHGTGPRI